MKTHEKSWNEMTPEERRELMRNSAERPVTVRSQPKCDHEWAVQAVAIGDHLRTCECSTEDAREFVRAIAGAVDDE